MASDDLSNIESLASTLSAAGFHARAMHDSNVPLLFALGTKKSHSIDLRRRDGVLVIEYWHGYPDDDFISQEAVDSFEEALAPIEAWLSKDAA